MWRCPAYPGKSIDGVVSGAAVGFGGGGPGFSRAFALMSRGSYAYNIGSSDAANWYRFGLAGAIRGLEGPSAPHIDQDELNSVSEAAVRSPANMIAIGDSIAAWPDGPTIIIEEGWDGLTRKLHPKLRIGRYATNMTAVTQGQRHVGRGNVGFVDGHVERIPIRNLYQSRATADLRRWHIDNEPHLELFP